MAADMMTIATKVAPAPGFDHCQPTLSCAHMAVANTTKTPTAAPRQARFPRSWLKGSIV
jgi:hypothetical protein